MASGVRFHTLLIQVVVVVLNIQKTHYIVFGNKTIDGKVSVLINNKIIDRVYESKFLGVYIDSRINWKYHIDKTRCKLSKSL